MTTPKATVVVGLDGSDASFEALDWAMAEAEHRDCAVEVITVWRYFEPLADQAAATGLGGMAGAEAVRPHAGMAALAEYIDEHMAAAAKRHPQAEHRHLNLGGRPAGEILVEAGARGGMLVVGSHGSSSTLRALLGSVSTHCLRHAECPVVILRAGGRHRPNHISERPMSGPTGP